MKWPILKHGVACQSAHTHTLTHTALSIAVVTLRHGLVATTRFLISLLLQLLLLLYSIFLLTNANITVQFVVRVVIVAVVCWRCLFCGTGFSLPHNVGGLRSFYFAIVVLLLLYACAYVLVWCQWQLCEKNPVGFKFNLRCAINCKERLLVAESAPAILCSSINYYLIVHLTSKAHWINTKHPFLVERIFQLETSCIYRFNGFFHSK